jgi:hypothetical protein
VTQLDSNAICVEWDERCGRFVRRRRIAGAVLIGWFAAVGLFSTYVAPSVTDFSSWSISVALIIFLALGSQFVWFLIASPNLSPPKCPSYGLNPIPLLQSLLLSTNRTILALEECAHCHIRLRTSHYFPDEDSHSPT